MTTINNNRDPCVIRDTISLLMWLRDRKEDHGSM